MTQKHIDNAAQFRTPVDPPGNSRKINLNSSILSIGSCFSEHIIQRFNNFLFNSYINPTGILYNPASISQALRRIISDEKYHTDDLFSHDGLWKSFDHHSNFDGKTPQECLQKINERIEEAGTFLAPPDTLILTFGTAFVYRKKDTGQLVANCHRLPHNTFIRSLLSIDDILTDYSELFMTLYKRFPHINIIITVSPIRHLRDNPHENQVSKAHLLSALFELESIFPHLFYFPSYEIMMDELRDYRFYKEDMVHPAPVAIEYIWKKFLTTCVGEKAQEFIRRYQPIVHAKSHAIQEHEAESTHHFAEKQIEYINELESTYPSISFTEDKKYFLSLL